MDEYADQNPNGLLPAEPAHFDAATWPVFTPPLKGPDTADMREAALRALQAI